MAIYSNIRLRTSSARTGHVGNSSKTPGSPEGQGTSVSENTWKRGSGSPLSTTSAEIVPIISSSMSKYWLLAPWNALLSPIRTWMAKCSLPSAKAHIGCSSYLVVSHKHTVVEVSLFRNVHHITTIYSIYLSVLRNPPAVLDDISLVPRTWVAVKVFPSLLENLPNNTSLGLVPGPQVAEKVAGNPCFKREDHSIPGRV